MRQLQYGTPSDWHADLYLNQPAYSAIDSYHVIVA